MPNSIKSCKQTNKKSYLLIRILGLNLTEKISLASTPMVPIPRKGCLLAYYCKINAAVRKLGEH